MTMTINRMCKDSGIAGAFAVAIVASVLSVPPANAQLRTMPGIINTPGAPAPAGVMPGIINYPGQGNPQGVMPGILNPNPTTYYNGYPVNNVPYGYGYPVNSIYSNPYAYSYPTFGCPQAMYGNYFGVSCGRLNLTMWKAPSGYYYPWCGGVAGYGYTYPIPIMYTNAGAANPTPALPAMSVIFSDMNKYLDEAKTDKRIQDDAYIHLTRRSKDLMSKEKMMRNAGDGALDPDMEAEIRRDLDQLGSEISRRVKDKN